MTGDIRSSEDCVPKVVIDTWSWQTAIGIRRLANRFQHTTASGLPFAVQTKVPASILVTGVKFDQRKTGVFQGAAGFGQPSGPIVHVGIVAPAATAGSSSLASTLLAPFRVLLLRRFSFAALSLLALTLALLISLSLGLRVL